MVIYFFGNHFINYQNCPFKGQLCLAGYAQSSLPWALSNLEKNTGEQSGLF